ncbi:MAG: DUF4249 domain-containing protein [Candidatus Kapabacteria bacterium]|nr:DUF4249 domain-containing protein [Candidatus Kapabacteria bacterium]
MNTIYLLLILLLILTSCEKVIEIDLNDSNSKYVIEAGIIADSNYASVRITRTKNFDEDNTFSPVPNAIVTIQDNNGAMDTLKQQSNGEYLSTHIRGEQNKTYMLIVRIGAETFTSTSTVPAIVPLQSVKLDSISGLGGPGRNSQYAVVPEFTDPKGIQNNYRFIFTKNNKTSDRILIQNDDFNDGLKNSRPLNIGNQQITKKDTLRIEMQCVDDGNFDYFQSLSQLTGNGPQASATPVNPVTNIKGGALGYFNAHTSQTVIIVVK